MCLCYGLFHHSWNRHTWVGHCCLHHDALSCLYCNGDLSVPGSQPCVALCPWHGVHGRNFLGFLASGQCQDCAFRHEGRHVVLHPDHEVSYHDCLAWVSLYRVFAVLWCLLHCLWLSVWGSWPACWPQITNINGCYWKEKYNNDETTKIKFIIIRNGQPYMKHASLCDIFTEKYSYSNAREMHDTLYCSL